MISVKPKLDSLSAKLAASYSDTSGLGSENSMLQGVVNVPVVQDKFALRAIGYRYDESGFYRNTVGLDPATIAWAQTYGLGDYVRGHVQDDVGRMRSTGGRLAALWQATDKLSLSMNFLTQTIEQDGNPLATSGQFEQRRIPIAPQGRVRGEAGEIADSDVDLLNLVLSYDFGWAELTSAASWIDSGTVYSISIGSEYPYLGPTSHLTQSSFKSSTGEVRLASQLEGRFQFLGGLFYEDVEQDYFGRNDWPGTPAANPYSTNPLSFNEITNPFDQHAVFGEVSYDLTDKLTATAGGRYFKYQKDERELREGALYGVALGAGVPVARQSNESDSSFKANLSYKPTPDSLLYASWAEGFRLGRPQARLNPVLCDNNPRDGVVDGTSVTIESTGTISSDFLENYEIGGKLTLFDRRISIDASVYHIKWDGLPIRTRAGTCTYIANAGAATSDGVEFQASLLLQDDLRLDFGGSYNKAELSEAAPALGAQKGAPLPGSPEVNINLAVQYDFEVAGHKTFVRADSFYAGEFYGNLLETPGTRAGDYIKVDARVGMAIRNVSVELFARNLTNENAYTWHSIAPVSDYRLRPRTVGVQLGYQFE